MISQLLLKQSFALIKFARATHIKPKISISQIVNKTLNQQIKKNKNIVLINEIPFPEGNISDSGYQNKHNQDNVFQVPLTPNANAGLAIGASLLGVKPITQFSTYSNALQAIDHIVNSSAKLRYMSAGILAGAPIFRSQNGFVEGYGAQNTQCFAAWYGSIPGLITIAPYDAQDYQGLLRTAIKSQDPVVILEDLSTFNEQNEVSQDILEEGFSIPFGKAKIMRRGRHVTLVAFSKNVKLALDAAQKLNEKGCQCEVINLRSIKPIDYQTIEQSVKKTGRIVTIESGFPSYGIGAHISSIMFQKCYQYLDAPLARVTSKDIPLAFSEGLQKGTLPQVSDIVKVVQKLMEGVKIA